MQNDAGESIKLYTMNDTGHWFHVNTVAHKIGVQIYRFKHIKAEAKNSLLLFASGDFLFFWS